MPLTISDGWILNVQMNFSTKFAVDPSSVQSSYPSRMNRIAQAFSQVRGPGNSWAAIALSLYPPFLVGRFCGLFKCHGLIWGAVTWSCHRQSHKSVGGWRNLSIKAVRWSSGWAERAKLSQHAINGAKSNGLEDDGLRTVDLSLDLRVIMLYGLNSP